MAASSELNRTIGILLQHTDVKTIASFSDTMTATEEITFGDSGPVGGTLNVFFTVPGTPISNAMKPYVVTTRGLYVGYQAKAGFLKTVPAVWFLGQVDIRGYQRRMTNDRGDVKRTLELHGPGGQAASMFTLQLSGSNNGYAKDALRQVRQGLGLSADAAVDF